MCLDVLSSSHHTAEPDFRPFSSRIDAMAFIIVHSPRPMVGIVYCRVIPIYGFIFHLGRVKPKVNLLYTKAIAALPSKCITDEAF